MRDHDERVKAAYLDGDVDYLYQALIDDEYFTEEELQLVTDVAGYSLRTLNDCIYSRYGYNDFEQLYDLDFEEDEEEEEEE